MGLIWYVERLKKKRKVTFKEINMKKLSEPKYIKHLYLQIKEFNECQSKSDGKET